MDHPGVIVDDGTAPTIGQTIARLRRKKMTQNDPVSYTHLTLPTSDLE